MIRLRDGKVSVAAEVLRTFAIFAVPFVLLPWVIFDAEIALGLVQFGLVILAMALVAVTLTVTSVAIWRHLIHRGNERVRVKPDDLQPPPATAGVPAPPNPTPAPVLSGANAKALPTKKDHIA